MRKQRDRVIDEIRKQIREGTLAGGDSISERTFSAAHGMSRVPVREALIHLEEKGLIRLVPGKGAFIRKFTLDEIRDLYEVRAVLEGQAALGAARVAPGERFRAYGERLRECLAGENAASFEELQALNAGFHDLVCRSCDNMLLMSLIATLHEQVLLMRSQAYRALSMEAHAEGAEEHIAVAEAIAAGDGGEAERLMRAHIASWFERQISHAKA